MVKTIVEAVICHGEKNPDKTAIIFKQDKISYGELSRQIYSMAFILKKDYQVQSRDTVMLSAVSKPEYVVALLALQYLGAITVPVDKTALEENICDVYFFNSAKLIFTDTRITNEAVHKYSLQELYKKTLESESYLKGTVSDAISSYFYPNMEEVAEMLFTTGTTGRPKGAMLSYKNLLASTCNTRDGVGMLESDVVLLPLPLNHSVGMRVTRTILYIGATMVIQNGFTFPKELKKNMQDHGCTGFVCVPAVLERLSRQMGPEFQDTLKALRYMEIGAGSLSYDMKKKMRALLPDTKIINTWGSTETGGAIFLNVSEYPDKLTSLGKPVPCIQLKVVDLDGNTIQARDMDTAGRMALQGNMQMIGYYHLEEATADALHDGWLFTNDLVYTDEDGFVYMLGRADDIINVGGEKVSPVEVENIASEHPALFECACIGVEDPEGILGQVPVLYYVPEEGENPDEREILKFLSTRMESYKLPKLFVRLTELPRNRMKKLDRKKLRCIWQESGDKNLTNPVIEAILSRQSIRCFTDQRIPKPVLESILRCGLQAPSANNMQTWRFTVLQDQEKIHLLKNLIPEVIKDMPGKKVKFYGFNNPDTVILLTNDKRNANGCYDCALAAENMMLAAHSLGIGSVWNHALQGLDQNEKIREFLTELGIHPRHSVQAVLLLGYPDGSTKKIERRPDVIHWI